MSDLLICTANFAKGGNEDALVRLKESCTFYGLGFEWYGDNSTERNWMAWKVHKLIDFLEGISHPYVLYTDGWDSWMLANEKIILDTYQSFEKPVVVGGHQHLYPYSLWTHMGIKHDDFPEAPTRFKFCCAGQFMGERESLIETLSILRDIYTEDVNDQGAWNTGIATRAITHIAEIDYECKLFLTLSGISHEQLQFDKENRAVFQETGSRPIGVHFGGAKGGSSNSVNMESFYDRWWESR